MVMSLNFYTVCFLIMFLTMFYPLYGNDLTGYLFLLPEKKYGYFVSLHSKNQTSLY